MSLRLDHVVILVRDLAAAQADYTALGFTVLPGGAHAGQPTHNALISLADGSYLELLARRPGATEPAHGLAARLLRAEPEEGLADFALLAGDLAATVTAARARGLEWTDPAAMGRTTPDGEQLGWTVSIPRTLDLPFLIADTTPRDRRVPGGAAQQHPNGVTGIVSLSLAVADREASLARYTALLGPEALLPPGARFMVGKTRLAFTPIPGSDRPRALRLRTTRPEIGLALDPVRTHHVPITLEPAPGP